MIKRKWICAAASALLFAGGVYESQAQSPDAPAAKPSIETLKTELNSVRAEIEAASRDLAQRNADLTQKQREIEYKDPEIVALREELVALEKQVLEKRQQIQTRLALKSEIKTVERERKELFQNVQHLRDTEAAIQREIAALEHGQK